MKRRELPELHDYSEDAEELMSRIPSKTVRWGLGVIGGLLVAFLVASCFIRCPKYDPMMRMKSVKLYFGPDEKVHDIYVNGYGVPGKVRLENPTLFECLFLRNKK